MDYDDTRICPGGCGARIPGSHLACAVDWERLPNLKKRFFTATCPHALDLHSQAVAAIVRWFQEHPSTPVTRPAGECAARHDAGVR